MKTKILCFAILSSALAFTAHASPSRRTAEYVRINATELVGDKIMLDVSCLKPVRQVLQPVEPYSLVVAHTWDDRENRRGGAIPVLLTRDRVDDAFRKFGAFVDVDGVRRAGPQVDTERLTGTLTRHQSGVLFVDTTGGAPADLELKLKGAMAEEGPVAKKGPRAPLKPRKPALRR